MTLHVSCDIETLDVEGRAVVVAIGACAFDENDIRSTFFRPLALQEQFDGDRKISEQTLLYWFSQSASAQAICFGRKRTPVATALAALIDWWQFDLEDQAGYMWSKGPGFDAAILSSLARQFWRKRNGDPWLPWNFRQERCVRTILDYVPADKLPKFEGILHHPLHDAMYQARCIQKAWSYMAANRIMQEPVAT